MARDYYSIWGCVINGFWDVYLAPILFLMGICTVSEWANNNSALLVGLFVFAMLIAVVVCIVIGFVHFFKWDGEPLKYFLIGILFLGSAIYTYDSKLSMKDFIKIHKSSVEYVDVGWVEKRFWREESFGAIMLNIDKKNIEKDLVEEEIRHQQLVENLRKSAEIEKKYAARAKARAAKRAKSGIPEKAKRTSFVPGVKRAILAGTTRIVLA